MVSIVPHVQRHLSPGPRTVAQQKLSGEREALINEINALVMLNTGRKDLFIHNHSSKTMTIINLVKVRDILTIIDQKREG